MKKWQKKHMTASAIKRRLQKKYPQGKPAKASNYIKYFKELIREKKGSFLPVVLSVRVSAWTQNHRGNLKRQIRWLKRELRRYGNVSIIAIIKHVGPGWKEGTRKIRKAARIARRRSGVIVAMSTDRLLRSPHYHSVYNPSAQPTDAEYEALLESVNGVTLATILHPDMTWKKVRGYQSKWGQKAKNNKGGRPKVNKPGYMKERFQEYLPIVLKLFSQNLSIRAISEETQIPKSTVADWIKKYS